MFAGVILLLRFIFVRKFWIWCCHDSSWLRLAVPGFSPWRWRLNPRQVRVGFLVDIVARRHVLLTRVIRVSPTVGPEWGSSQDHHSRFSNCEFPLLTSVLGTNSHLLVLTVSFYPSLAVIDKISHIEVNVKFSHYRPGVAQRVGRGIALLFHDRDTRRGWVVSSTLRHILHTGKTRYPFCRRLGGPPWPIWTGGKSRPHRDLIPDRSAGSQSLYRLNYLAHRFLM